MMKLEDIFVVMNLEDSRSERNEKREI